MYAADVVALDRRSVVSVPTLHGRDAVRDNIQALRDVGFNRVRSESLAVRGERLVLQRVTFSTDDGREMTTLGLNEWVDGAVTCRVVFDEDALDDAVAELEARFAAGEGRPHAEILETVARSAVCTNARDWDGIRSLLQRALHVRGPHAGRLARARSRRLHRDSAELRRSGAPEKSDSVGTRAGPDDVGDRRDRRHRRRRRRVRMGVPRREHLRRRSSLPP